MKFRNGILIVHVYSKQMYLVLSSNKVGNYEVLFCSPEYDEKDTMWLFNFNMGDYVIASDEDIINIISEQLRHELLSNYAEGL